ncbi:hypothetical protein CPB86DRAFT_625502 [Serendipita vermifera]|nr:hypothetical protein CPB86DRAFT_625502 [Serendipita vermifera]
MRVYTLYVQKILAQRFLLLALFLSHCAIVTITVILYREISHNMQYSPVTGLCRGKRSTTATGIAYMTPSFIETVVLIMTLMHAFRYPLPDLGETKSAAAKIVHALYRDGCIYYLIILSMRLVAVIMYYRAPDALVMLVPMTEWALVSTVTSRWFLSFRKVLVLNLSPEIPMQYNSRSKPFTGASISGYHVGELSSNLGSVPHHLSLSHYRQTNRTIARTSCSGVETSFIDGEADVLPNLHFEALSDGEIKTLVTE